MGATARWCEVCEQRVKSGSTTCNAPLRAKWRRQCLEYPHTPTNERSCPPMSEQRQHMCVYVCVCVCGCGGVRESMCAVGRLAGQSAGARGHLDLQRRQLIHLQRGHTRFLQTRGGKIDLRARERRRESQQNTLYGAELGQIGGAKHMTGRQQREKTERAKQRRVRGSGKAPRRRESNTPLCKEPGLSV